MKDIDFDELDKAVNSLMSRNTQKDVPAAPPVEKTDMPLTAAPVSPGVIKPKSEVATNPDTQPAVTPQPASAPKPLARSMAAPASRRGGRFMDVVPKKPASSMRPVSREGIDLGMRSAATPSEALSPMPGVPSRVETASATPTPEKAAPVNEWPDPIEMHAGKEATVAPEASPKVQPEKETEKTSDQPLTSPFLPDTKVEKRPLGSPSPLTPMVAPEHELMTPTPDDSEAQLPAKPSDVAPETPEEFNHDLMSVEADTHMGVPKTDETHPIDRKYDEPTAAPKTESVTSEEESVTPEMPAKSQEHQDTPRHTPKKDEETTTGRISIPQQYREQPSSGETESGAIYDTDAYHQPLSHPAKKSSGWWWVLWILLILIVGVGAGVGLYFLGIM